MGFPSAGSGLYQISYKVSIIKPFATVSYISCHDNGLVPQVFSLSTSQALRERACDLPKVTQSWAKVSMTEKRERVQGGAGVQVTGMWHWQVSSQRVQLSSKSTEVLPVVPFWLRSCLERVSHTDSGGLQLH